MRKGRILFCVFLICVAAAAIFMALDWPFKAALFPLSVSIPLLILASTQLLQLLVGKEEIVESAAVDLAFSSDVPPEIERRRVITAFSWIVGFILSVYLIGFPLTVPLFICFYLAATAITWVIFYALFQKLVHLQFEEGALQAWLGL
ncbi:MAG: Tripartite tricarboxylate transporter TctB family protein [Deltaproteobacteria bacterium]|nr:Tripartite tricarboxylate transporter TctB family protein [Deltaproteobacteria bacterium]